MPNPTASFYHPFVAFSTEHLAALAGAALLGVAAWLLGPRLANRPEAAAVCGWVLLGLWCAATLTMLGTGKQQRLLERLPLHMCNVSLLGLALGFLWHGYAPAAASPAMQFFMRRVLEFGVFFGFVGAWQAMATPDLDLGFPSIRFILFFVAHAAIPAALIVAVRAGIYALHPGQGPWWPIISGNVYYFTIALVNWLLSTNYAYLCAKPPKASPLDNMGPWPYYAIAMNLLATANVVVVWAVLWVASRPAGTALDETR